MSYSQVKKSSNKQIVEVIKNVKKRIKTVVSCFDGYASAFTALKELGILPERYFSIEVDKYAIKVANYNHPSIIQLGDITKVASKQIKGLVDLLVGGSPCQGFSFAGRRKGMTTITNIEILTLEHYLQLKSEGFQFEGQSYLFWEFVRLYKELKPKYFFFENVKMSKKWEKVITETLGVEPIRINSSLVSAQNRDRLYWTNLSLDKLPKDRKITLDKINPNAVTGAGFRGRKFKKTDKKYTQYLTIRKDRKANCCTTKLGSTAYYLNKKNELVKLTVEEFEMLQTLRKGYTNVPGVSKTQRIKMIGNAWTIEVVKLFFKSLLK